MVMVVHALSSFADWLTRIALAGVLSVVCSCDVRPPSDQPPAPPVIEAHKPVLWKRINDAVVAEVGHGDAALQEELDAATRQARTTLDDARQRWTVATPADRGLWAVKWAAPIAATHSSASMPAGEGGLAEHVWVRPVNWSPFRIEGALLSQPTLPLECGRVQGEIVAFPADEVSDWVHFASPAQNAAFEGGFTLRVLEGRFGPPGGQDAAATP